VIRGVKGEGFRFQDSGFRFQVSGFRIQVSGFRFQFSGFRFQDSGFRFQVSSLIKTGSVHDFGQLKLFVNKRSEYSLFF